LFQLNKKGRGIKNIFHGNFFWKKMRKQNGKKIFLSKIMRKKFSLKKFFIFIPFSKTKKIPTSKNFHFRIPFSHHISNHRKI